MTSSLDEFIQYGKAVVSNSQQQFVEGQIPMEKSHKTYVIYPSERDMIEALGISDETYVKYKYFSIEDIE